MASLRIAQIVTNGNIFLRLKALLDPYLAKQGRFWLRLFLYHKRRQLRERRRASVHGSRSSTKVPMFHVQDR